MPDDNLYIGPTVLAPGAPGDGGVGNRLAQKILIPLAALFLLVLLVFYVFFDRGRVDGPSMLPTLHNADMVLLTKGYAVPHRGDVIFTRTIENGAPIELVKRVIGIPGDTVQVKEDVAFVNGVAEPQRGQYIDPALAGSFVPLVVPNGQLFVMGDNRPVSEDSRLIGTVPIAGVMGRVVAIYAPIGRVRLVH
jgi:signal peptidase I